MSDRHFRLDIDDGIATITFDWPHAVNAMGVDYARGFHRVLDRVEERRDARVVVLTGAGRVFNGGGDLQEIMSPDPTDMEAELELIRGYNRIAQRLYYFERPVIAAVNGPAVGGGVGIALAADFAVAAHEARYDFAFHRLGLSVADVGVPWLLQRAIGPQLAAYFLMTAGTIDAARGRELGLFAEVVPRDELQAGVRRIAAAIMDAPDRALRISKLSLRHGVDMQLTANMELEAYLQSFAFRSPGHKQRIAQYRARLSRRGGGA